jgi:hypothetical protein
MHDKPDEMLVHKPNKWDQPTGTILPLVPQEEREQGSRPATMVVVEARRTRSIRKIGSRMRTAPGGERVRLPGIEDWAAKPCPLVQSGRG